MAHPFIVGETYFDRKSEYTVVAIGDGRMTIRYHDGTEKICDPERKARIYQNILAEQGADHPYQSLAYFEAIGYLASHAEFQAEVPPQSQANFEERYRLYTGIRPILHQDGYYPIEVEDPYDKWGPELRIYFPDPLRELDLPAGVEICEGNAPGILRINNNNFWWQLTRAGFRLGRNHRVEGIRQTVPPRYHQGFDRGYEL